MDEQQQIDEGIVRVTDILEQIRELNKMIDFHRAESGEKSMIKQYVQMRLEFLNELKVLLKSFRIDINPSDFAA